MAALYSFYLGFYCGICHSGVAQHCGSLFKAGVASPSGAFVDRRCSGLRLIAVQFLRYCLSNVPAWFSAALVRGFHTECH